MCVRNILKCVFPRNIIGMMEPISYLENMKMGHYVGGQVYTGGSIEVDVKGIKYGVIE